MNSLYGRYYTLLFTSYPLKIRKMKITGVHLNHLPSVELYPEHKKDAVLSLFTGQTKLYLQLFQEQRVLYSSTDQ